MDCLKAQELISTALDREPVEAAELELAKEHCRECEECAAFVGGLLALQKATPPHPSAEFTDRVMARLRAEQREISPVPAAVIADPPAEIAPSADAPIPEATVRPVTTAAPAVAPASNTNPPTAAGLYALAMERIRDPRRRREVIAWTASAAVVLVAAGFAAMAGMRAILIPRPIPATESTILAGSGDGRGQTSGTGQAPTFGSNSAADLATKSSPEVATPPDLVVLNGTVYKLAGPASDVTRTDLTSKGSVRSSLAAAGSASAHDALGSADPARIYIESQAELLAFDRVTRSFNGATYALQSGSLDNFGQWPTWSSAIAKPVTETGSPSFSAAGADASGVTVFKPIGGSASAGIAVPPNAPSSDPMAGAPDWTWWTPLK